MTFTTPEPAPSSLSDLASTTATANSILSPVVTNSAEPATGTVPAVEVSKHLATQTEFPTRTAIRAGVTSFLSTVALGAAAAIAAAPYAAKAAEKILPGTPVGADILATAAVIGVIATTVNRISNLAPVAKFLTSLHIGPVPKN